MPNDIRHEKQDTHTVAFSPVVRLPLRAAANSLAVLILLVVSTIGVPGQRRATYVGLSQAYAWFDTLGYPDVRNLHFVDVFVGTPREDVLMPQTPDKRVAFLVKDDGVNFTVFYPDLTTSTLRRTPPSIKNDKRVGYEALDITEWVSKRLSAIETGGDWRYNTMSFGGPHGGLYELFVISRACAGHGHEQLADDLFRSAGPWSTGGHDAADDSVTSAMAEGMAHDAVWRAILRFDDPKSSRSAILADYRDVVRRFPATTYTEEAKSKVAVLSRMVTEDREHIAAVPSIHSPPSPDERIADLIFELRDQNGHQFSQPGSCDVFMDPRGEQSPANQLVKIGPSAVPQLIDALDCDNFTRSIEYGRNFMYSHSVLTIADASLAIIEKIAHRSFSVNGNWGRAFTGTTSEVSATKNRVKSAIRAWFDEFQADGGKHALISGTAQGNAGSPEQARELSRLYPADAVKPIITGIERASEPDIGQELLQSLATIKTEDVTTILRGYVSSRWPLLVRCAAANELLERGDDSSLDEMISLWKAYKDDGDNFVFDPFNVGRQIADFLMNCRRVEAISALGDGLSARTNDVRMCIVALILNGETGSGERRKEQPHRKDESSRNALFAAAEDLLARELLDTDVGTGLGYTRSVKSDRPRICDVAAASLAEIRPDKYKFSMSSSERLMDTQRMSSYQIWKRGSKTGRATQPR